MGKVKTKKTGQRMIAFLVVTALLITTILTGIPAKQVEAAQDKVSMDENAYHALGFKTDAEDPEEGYFGTGNTVLNAKKELFFDYNGSSNYGHIIRDNLHIYNNVGSGDRKGAGAYQMYGQYKNNDWAKLSNDNGYGNGQTGGDILGSDLHSDNKHKQVVYATSTEFKSASGKEDRVAQLEIVSDAQRANFQVRLDMFRFDFNGTKYIPKRTQRIYLGSPCAFDQAGNWYNEQYDALMEVTAGDYDGDGIDEVAIYYADNVVKVYKTTNDRYTEWKTISSGEIGTDTRVVMDKTDSPANAGKKMAAVVTLASGDLQKDYTEDLVIGVSMPKKLGAAIGNYAYIYGYDKKSKSLTKDETINLNNISVDDTGNSYRMFAMNVTIGDLSGNGRPELVIGGRLGELTNERKWMGIAAVHVEYNFNSQEYDVMTPQVFTQNLDGNFYDSSNGGPGYYAPIGLSICDFGIPGKPAQHLFLLDQLYTCSDGIFARANVSLRYSTEQKNNANENANKDLKWISKIVSDNFIGDESGSKQLAAIVGVKEAGQDKYWYQICFIAKKGDTWYTSWEGIINQATSYLNRSDKSRASAYVSFCAPDIDDDATVLKYIGAETYYTKPEVQAVLQSSPYFQDVADVYEDSYINDGTTAYGTSEGSGNAVTASIEASVGVYSSVEVSLFGEGEFEAGVAATTSYEHQTAWETSTSVEYAGNTGDDYVVMYTIPYHRYWYEFIDTNGKAQTMSIEEPMTPSTVIVPIDTYDAMTETYKGLEPIGGNLIKSTPGEPSTYLDTFRGKFTAIGAVQALSNAGSNSSSEVTVSREESVSHENSFSVGVEEELKVGGGAGLMGTGTKTGITQSLAVSAGYVHSSMNGVTYTGTVDNLPSDVKGYGFNWQFGAEVTKLNNESVVLIGYKLSNIKELPKPPKNLSITEITSTTMTLEWDGTSSAAAYELILITNNGMELPQATIPSTQARDDGSVQYIVKDLSPNTEYSYKVVGVDASGVRTLSSAVATGTTLPDNQAGFKITKQPQDKQVYIGGTAVFEIEAENNTDRVLKYRWQTYDSADKSWNFMSSGYNQKLSVTGSEELDGSSYRCIVYTGGTLLTSNTARLTIGKSDSTTMLTVKNEANKTLANNALVKASETELAEVKVGTVEVPYDVTATINNVTYTKMEDNSGHIVWMTKDGEGKSHYYGNQNTGGKDSPVTGDGKELSAVQSYTFVTYKDQSDDFEIDKRYDTGDFSEIPSGVTTPSGVTVKEWKKYCEIAGSDDTNKTYIFVADVTSGSDTVTKYYDKDGKEVFLYDDRLMISVNDSTSVNALDFSEVQETRQEDVMEQQMQMVGGDKLTFSAAVTDEDQSVTDSAPSFQVVNTATGVSSNVASKLDGEVYTAEYTFSQPGVYEVVAVYGGSDRYNGSRSDSITLIVQGTEDQLHITGGTMIYGETMDLNPTLLNESGSQAVSKDIVYTVTRDGKTLTADEAGIFGNSFTPLLTGTYQIMAEDTKNHISTEAVVTVDKRTLTITPANVEANINNSRQERTKKLDDTKSYTNTEIEGKVFVSGLTGKDTLNYSLASEALNASGIGEYPIYVENVSSISAENYTMVLNRAVYTLTQDRVQVNAKAGANGAVSLHYQISEDTQPIEIENGTYIPKGAKVIVTAQPKSGFGVDKWTVNGKQADYEGAEYVVESLDADIDVSVTFSYNYSTLTYGFVGEGSIEGAYAGTGQTSFASGGKLNQQQSVVLTAVPDEGFTVDFWEIRQGTGAWENIKAEDEKSNFTGTSYTVTDVHEDTQIRVHFKAKEEKTITLQFKNRDDSQVVFSAGTGLSVNGNSVTAVNSVYTYQSFLGENLTLDVTVPDNMLIDHWTVKDSTGTEVNVANNVKQLKVYDLDGDHNYVVYCSIPNQCQVEYEKVLDDSNKNGGDITEAGTLTASIGKNSPLSLPQGADITFTAVPNQNYRISKWVVNDEVITDGIVTDASGSSQKYTMSVKENDTVLVYFEQKPTVSYNAEHGTVIMNVGPNTIKNNGHVEFDSNVTWTITPDEGYFVSQAALNGTDITKDLQSASGDEYIRYYTADHVNSRQSLEVTFKKLPVVSYKTEHATVTMSSGSKDIVNNSYVKFGSSVTWTITPDKSYVVDQVMLNGTDITKDCTDAENNKDVKTYVLENVTKNQELTVSCRSLKTYTVNYSVVDIDQDGTGDNGQIKAKSSRLALKDYEEEKEAALSGTINVYEGGEAILTPIPESEYRVKECTVNGETYNLQSDGTIKLTSEQLEEMENGTAEVTVQFVVGAPVITFADPMFGDEKAGTLTAQAAGTEIVSGAAVNGKITFTAVPDANYEVKGWSVNGTLVEGETKNQFVYANTFRIDSEVSVILQGVKVNITATSENNEAGTVEKLPETIRYQDEVVLKAQAKTGYVFDGWYLNKKKVSTQEEYTITAQKDASYVAKFVSKQEKQIYNITLEEVLHGTVSAKVNGVDVTSVEEGDEVTFTAVPDANWNFDGWTINGQTTDQPETFTWIAGKDFTQDLGISASFAQAVYYEVTFGVESGQGTIEGRSDDVVMSPDTVLREVGGSTLTFTAKPEAGQMVDGWTINGEPVKDNITTKLTVNNLSERTEVKVFFEDYKGYEVPETTEKYAISDVVRTPADTEKETEIRQEGTLTFTMTPAEGTTFTKLNLYGVDCIKVTSGKEQTVTVNDQKSKVTVIKNKNGSYKITIKNVQKEILADSEIKTAIIIDKASVSVSGQNFVYNGKKQIPSKLVVSLRGTILTKNDYNVTYKNNKNAGVATITVTGKNDYIGTATGTFQIKPKSLTIQANNRSKYYSYDDPKLTYKTTGLVSGDKVSVTIKRKSGENPGKYTITVKAAKNANYKITCKNGTFTIKDGKLNPTLVNKLNIGLGTSWSGNVLTIKWGNVSLADGYDIFAAKCGTTLSSKPVATAKKGQTSVNITKISGVSIKTRDEYKIVIKPFRKSGAKKIYTATSYSLHRAGRNSRRWTNVKKIELKKDNFTLNKGKTAQITVKLTKENSRKTIVSHVSAAGKGVNYWSVNKKVATVTKTGQINAVGKGTTTIYVMADDGIKVKVTVKVK